jgi:hypothetical protein
MAVPASAACRPELRLEAHCAGVKGAAWEGGAFRSMAVGMTAEMGSGQSEVEQQPRPALVAKEVAGPACPKFAVSPLQGSLVPAAQFFLHRLSLSAVQLALEQTQIFAADIAVDVNVAG